MAEELIVENASKEASYESLLTQLKALCNGEPNLIANLANISAGLKQTFDFFWVGFYLVDTPQELILGPFQGTIACTRIYKGKGVCGTAWANQKSIIVPNVDEFPGHIACSALSKSEIVVPIFNRGEIIGVLDIDSDKINDFDKTDQAYLEKICEWIGTLK